MTHAYPWQTVPDVLCSACSQPATRRVYLDPVLRPVWYRSRACRKHDRRVASASDARPRIHACGNHSGELMWRLFEARPDDSYTVCASPFRMSWKTWLKDCTPFAIPYYAWGTAVTAYWKTLGRRRLVLADELDASTRDVD
jgi:hypothetical protein